MGEETVNVLFVAFGEPARNVALAAREKPPRVAVNTLGPASVARHADVYRPLGGVVPLGEASTSFALLLLRVTALPATALAKPSRAFTLTVAALTPSATIAFGDTDSEDVLAFGEPATVMAVATRLPLPAPKLAVTVRVCATELRSALTKRPATVVLPLPTSNVSGAALLASVTARAGTGLLYASTTTRVMLPAATVSATNSLGEMSKAESNRFGAPATKLTACVKLTFPEAAVTPFASALVDVNVVAKKPLASVAPLAWPKWSLPLLLANATACAAMGLERASRRVMATLAAATPSAVRALGETEKALAEAFGEPAVAASVVVTLTLPMWATMSLLCACVV